MKTNQKKLIKGKEASERTTIPEAPELNQGEEDSIPDQVQSGRDWMDSVAAVRRKRQGRR